ncbi:hypothetical protein, conserved [Babesia bigemina]|uniref:Uncharacterized protein n=1 Tax=Babesia bigemina TaxID=5866 RepID=A0A061D435_BABBI|nr:hypothetical protein, conserved [Babesia bigemina]CDR95318.1 hypothetical protein, conserved [Babesia bigemina]|eukprot:XP_012767504.1 hypothetical protein, conserved [Babesia bigemina]
MEEETGSLPTPHSPPADGRDVIEVSQEEFEDSQRFLQSQDAIMDDSVFMHIRKVIAYLYRKEADTAPVQGSGSVGSSAQERQSEYLAELNTNVLNTLVEGYVGYAWLCEVCARWIEELNVQNSQYLSMRGLGERREGNSGVSGTVNIIREALMSFLKQNYDSEKMRIYMEDKADHDKWNPPELYWNLMKSPLVVSHMINIYRERPKDEFLSSWYQDYMNTASAHMKLEQADIDREGLSRITSNFSVFTLRISEEIRKFLMKDDVLDAIELDGISPLSPLFWHAENAYIYSQALLHFIYQWRNDLKGCRRLSQLIARTTMRSAEGLFPDEANVDGKMYEWSASQIHLLMTNFSRFPNLHSSFKRLCANPHLSSFRLNEMDVCDFYDELNKTLNAFDNYGILLFDQSRDRSIGGRPQPLDCTDDVGDSVSQYGDPQRSDEYTRLRNAPEMPPLEAIRESNILNQLIDDFSNADVHLPDSNTWIRYANLLVLLSVPSPYELLYFHYDELVCNHLKRLPQREVWKQFYLPVGSCLGVPDLPQEYDDESSLDEMEHLRDFGTSSPDEDACSSDLYSLHLHSPSHDMESDFSFPAGADKHMNDAFKPHKAWNNQSMAPASRTLRDADASSFVSGSAFESELCHNMEVEPIMGKYGGKVQVSTPSSCSDSSTGLGKRGFGGIAGGVWLPVAKRTVHRDGTHSADRDDEYLEIKSTLASAIYKNTNEGTKLGAPKNISAERLNEMRDMYASFKIQSDRVKAIARKELYHLHKIIHNASMDPVERDFEMRDVISTVIASSVVMAYIRHDVMRQRSIRAVSDSKLLLLMDIANKHPVKRTPIAVFLRDVCVACAEGKIVANSSSAKLERLQCIMDLLLYVARFERQCVPVVSIFTSIMHRLDRSISRHFVTTLFTYCGAPYGEEFMRQLLTMVEKYLRLGVAGTASVPNVNDATVVNGFLRPFLDECAQTWARNNALADVVRRCKRILQNDFVL